MMARGIGIRSGKPNDMFALKTNIPFGCDHQPSPFPPFTLLFQRKNLPMIP